MIVDPSFNSINLLALKALTQPPIFISLSINGEEKQSASINMMVWGIEELISILSQKVILKPGDILFTGTPAGVGNIKKGDILEASIDEVGALKLNFE